MHAPLESENEIYRPTRELNSAPSIDRPGRCAPCLSHLSHRDRPQPKIYTDIRFLPRDAMSNLGLCCGPVSIHPSVRLSVRLSRWWIVSRRLKISSNLFLGLVAPSLSFLIPCADTQFQGEPFQRGRKIHGVGKFCDFRWKSPSISETARDRPMTAKKRQ